MTHGVDAVLRADALHALQDLRGPGAFQCLVAHDYVIKSLHRLLDSGIERGLLRGLDLATRGLRRRIDKEFVPNHHDARWNTYVNGGQARVLVGSHDLLYCLGDFGQGMFVS